MIEGGDETPVTMPRTAFQMVYPDCTVMIDAGLDQVTHDSFSPDKREPYFPGGVRQARTRAYSARLIVLTHYHADHVAGVVTARQFSRARAQDHCQRRNLPTDGDQPAPAAPALTPRAGGRNSSCSIIRSFIRWRRAWC